MTPEDTGAPPASPAAPAPPSSPPQTQALSFDGYPDDVRVTLNARGVTPDADGFKSLAKQYHDANRYILTNGVRDVAGVPGKDAPPEAWDRLYTALGRPPSPDAYQIKVETSDGAQVNGEFLTFGRSLMHKFGVPAERAQEFVDDYLGYSQKAAAAESARQEQVITEIKQREGAAFDQKVARGQEAVRKLGLSAEVLGGVEKQLGTGPMLQLFMALGSKLAEGSFVPASGSAPVDPSQMSADQAKTEIDRLQADETFSKAYYDAQHPEHATALKRMEALYAARSRR